MPLWLAVWARAKVLGQCKHNEEKHHDKEVFSLYVKYKTPVNMTLHFYREWVRDQFSKICIWCYSLIATGCCCLVAQSCLINWDPMGCKPTRLLCPWNSPRKNIGVYCHSLLQGISPTQGLNLGLLHCRQILYHLSSQRSTATGRFMD